MQTISSIRFTANRNGEFRGEVTVTMTDGTRSYPRVTNLASAITKAKELGAEIRGTSRVVTLKDPARIAENGGKPTVEVKEYYTTPVRMECNLLGDYAEVEVTALAGITKQDNALLKALSDGVATPVQAPRRASQANSVEDLAG